MALVRFTALSSATAWTSRRTLAVGSTTGAWWISRDDGGEGWHEVSPHLPAIHAVRWSNEAGRKAQ